MAKDIRLVEAFLKKFKEIYEETTGEEFHPRHLLLLFQDKTNSKELIWLAWHQWFDNFEYSVCQNQNLLEALIDNFVHILIEAEENRKIKMLMPQDEKKLEKILKLASEIKIFPNGIGNIKCKKKSKKKK